MFVNNLPTAAPDSMAAGSRTHDLSITIPAPYHYATEPHVRKGISLKCLASALFRGSYSENCQWAGLTLGYRENICRVKWKLRLYVKECIVVVG